MNEPDLMSWIRYHDARFGGFAKWAVAQLKTDEGREFIGKTLGAATLDEACKATDELDDREDQPRGITAQFRTFRAILNRRRGNRALSNRPRRDPVLQNCNHPAWLGYAVRSLQTGESIRESIEYWQMVWGERARRIKAEPQNTMATAWEKDCSRRIRVVDAFADLEPEVQERYMRRANGLLPMIDEGKSGDPSLDAQAVAFALFQSEKMMERVTPIDYGAVVRPV